jgi:hypothetical protein
MSQEKCSNFLLCCQFINKNVNNLYCKDCLFYFNYKLTFKSNHQKNISSTTNENDNNIKKLLVCPLCFYSPTLFIKQKSCKHYICSQCIFDIYFDKSYIKNIPVNPIFYLKKSWDLYIYSNQASLFNRHVINKFSNSEFHEPSYNLLINKYLYLVPYLFKKNIKELIFYQLQKNKYIYEYKDSQNKKINTIKTCPYCRKNDESDNVDSSDDSDDVENIEQFREYMVELN